MENHWFTISQLNDQSWAISEYGHWEKVHSFLLTGKKRACLIDTGIGIADIAPVIHQLTDLPVTVVTTHVHWDHIGSHGSFEDILVHEEEADWLENGIKGLPLSQIRKDIGRDLTKPAPEEFNPETYVPYTGRPAGLIKDGDCIDLGGRTLSLIHTPGHSPGHVCVYDHATGFLFTGDLLYDETPVYAFYPTTNPADLVNSWVKIAAIDNVIRIFGSHNTLGLSPALLTEVEKAARTLRAQGLDQFGTGVHHFNGFSVKF
ncbi:MBL fold metallo-hydrolase [Alteribacter lacisalsi]|uniref:MBL fold metallo-hydrolase n=1 Tax=Alteribacter lacisalsi TaxID=2045244 RepID=A0A2W0HVQ0_9BACI|nr:MBL fold metallo-hydrolase [Alteribacter lacisalsi]PYZ97768.1 MBL fold metallo-hydrolase [Alteribacter lacisalsi]